MESFVPFGGFFSSPSDMKSPFSSSNQHATCCPLCNEKCKQELSSLAEGGFTASVADQYQSSLPSWSQMTELSKNRDMDAAKAKDSSVLLRTKVERKWDTICQRLHQAQPYVQMLPKAAYKFGTQVPAIVGFQVVEGRKESFDHSIDINNASSAESGCEDFKSCRSMDLRHYPPAEAITQLPSKLAEKPSKIEELGVGSSLSSSSNGDDRASPMSANSVTTDLGLGVNSASVSRELEEPTHQAHVKSSSTSCPVFGQCDQKDYKMLYTSLSARIGRQEEAVSVVSQTIARCRTRNDKRPGSRGDIWFIFVGPDKIAKKKIVVSLAETLYGKRENLICVDLSLQDSVDSTNVMINSQLQKGYDVKFRGKTVVDYIAEELGKKPLSVVFLENVDKADVLAQSHLSRALRTGRFSDSHGREVSISNAIFVATSSNFTEGCKILSPEKELAGYSEEDILRSKGCPFQMLIGFDLGDVLDNTRQTKANPMVMNKRKLVGISETLGQGQSLEITKRAHKASNVFLDLNLPAEESENSDTDHDNITENSKAWLDDFFGQVDETVVFKPFDFDALAKKLVKEISECFHKTIGSVGLLELDSQVIEQILAAAYLLENNAVEDWIDRVLGSAFVEAQKRYTLSSRTVVKLVKCEGLFPEEQSRGILLPARIVMN